MTDEEKKKEEFQTNMLKTFTSSPAPEITEEKEQAITKQMPLSKKFDNQLPSKYKALRPPSLKIGILAIFWGNIGAGKTCEALTNARESFINREVRDWYYDTEMGLITMLKAGFNDGTFNKNYEKMKKIDFLIVDEMGKVNDSEFNNSLIFDILNYRYMWEKRTILICNAKTKEDVKNILTPAIVDRFREYDHHFDGKTQRY